MYPPELYDRIFEFVPQYKTAWDVATGNGQVAQVMATKFNRIIATDISVSQLKNSIKHPNIEYRLSSAEESGIEENTIDLVSVGQAAHWFDFERFCSEVERVCVDRGILAIWCYSLFESPAEINKLVRNLYDDILGSFWHPRRKLIDNRYIDLVAPFEVLTSENHSSTIERTPAELTGYIGTWSAVNKYIKETGQNPVSELYDKILKLVGPDGKIPCKTTYTLKLWRVHKTKL